MTRLPTISNRVGKIAMAQAGVFDDILNMIEGQEQEGLAKQTMKNRKDLLEGRR